MAQQTQYRLVNPPPRVDATEGALDHAPADVPRELEIEGLTWEFDGWDADVALYRRSRGDDKG